MHATKIFNLENKKCIVFINSKKQNLIYAWMISLNMPKWQTFNLHTVLKKTKQINIFDWIAKNMVSLKWHEMMHKNQNVIFCTHDGLFTQNLHLLEIKFQSLKTKVCYNALTFL